MNGTPRLRAGAFPSTPQNTPGQPTRFTSSTSPNNGTPQRPRNKLPAIQKLRNFPPPEPPQEPLISLETVDAATQRFFVVSFYAALWAYRIYDFYTLLSGGNDEQLWLFLKWVLMDGIFLFAIPSLRIPWLEPSSPALVFMFLGHVLLNGMMMFQVSIPLVGWIASIGKALYNPGEESLGGHTVKREALYNDPRSIQGKVIVNILPEGSAIINPNQESFCLGGSTNYIDLPIQINQTEPTRIELQRSDFDTSEAETITITAKAAKSLMATARKSQKPQDSSEPLVLRYAVKKPGRYILQKVVDKTSMEVTGRSSEAIVVRCPSARLVTTSGDKCKGELSDISFEVTGTPPLKLKYRKMVNSAPIEASFQSIQPEDFVSPYARKQQGLGIVTTSDDQDVSWARARSIKVPVNETLFNSGSWWYTIDQVEDAIGNVVAYKSELEDYAHSRNKLPETQQVFTVHERPRISLDGCDSQHPLKVAKGSPVRLPVSFEADGRPTEIDAPHDIEYVFTPEEDLKSLGEHNPATQQALKHNFRSPRDTLLINNSGLYSLKSVSTKFCSGEVREPASCLLQNPPEPKLEVSATNLTDKCAGNPVGLQVTLDLVGTPPFEVWYKTERKGHGIQTKPEKMTSHRQQVQLQPIEEGDYTYTFYEISDYYYKAQQVDHRLEQTVKPSASAHFVRDDPDSTKASSTLCLSQAATFKIRLGGEGPWNLGYELVHGGQRKKQSKIGIIDVDYIIETEPLESGGDYTIVLTSIEAGGCKEQMKEEISFKVRHQRPKVSFGLMDGKRSVIALADKQIALPVRLSGERPWKVEYRNANEPTHPSIIEEMYNENFSLLVKNKGTYELMSVHDNTCPGTIDETADKFEVTWIQRPTMELSEESRVTRDEKRDLWVKNEVCEGDEASVELSFTGNPQFSVRYEETAKPNQGQKSVRKRDITAALPKASIRLDTEKAGEYTYKFLELADANYDPESQPPIVLTQRVNSRPTARFATPGKVYNFCAVNVPEEEVIPVILEGVPPFNVELDVKHAGSAKGEWIPYKDIPTNKYDLRIESKYLKHGPQTVTIKQVTDSRGCRSRPEIAAARPRVQVSVHDPPTISDLTARSDLCVGNHVEFQLAGTAPFTVHYTFDGKSRKASVGAGAIFKKLAAEAGIFTIDAVADSASHCRAAVSSLQKVVHPLPRGKLAKGRVSHVDIHEGHETDIIFDFEGTPPFEFTYTRSTEPKRGVKQVVLETKTETTWDEHVQRKVSSEGEYELIGVKDAHCSVKKNGESGPSHMGKKRLTK
ncbi:hypothetical protein E6O75_ATG07325 [Venturia nashicola]|uniref:Nucleoporin Pom152 n=1 Tax=Venturia nashicola TaxID=86259 RepID=A0A4Z1NTU5_9PEZI|nr:hypothetical protein E6O75_ATG07325 [Venturia nashicola]